MNLGGCENRAMLSGFQNFLLRGNVVDLAVGVVMGAAFGNVVTAFTKSFLDPLIRLVGGGKVAGTWELRAPSVVDGLNIPPLVIDYGSFLTALIGFVLTAAVIYFRGGVADEYPGRALQTPGKIPRGRGQQRGEAAGRDPGRAPAAAL